MGGISVWQLLIILVIVVLLFGTKRLKGIGTDLGGAIKGFKKAVSEEEKTQTLNKRSKLKKSQQQSLFQLRRRATLKKNPNVRYRLLGAIGYRCTGTCLF